MNFTFDAYSNLILLIQSQGYVLSGFHNYSQSGRPAILRHDVDISLEAALRMARLEHGLGISATYFILMSSDFYNPFSRKSMECILEIERLGHEIGLHFDEARYGAGMDFAESVNKEIKMMEAGIPIRIRAVSMHRPSPAALRADYAIDGGRIINSYSREFFHYFKYVSDSRGAWNEDIEAIVRSGAADRLHILVHPIWYGDGDEGIPERLKRFCLSAVQERYEILDKNIRHLQDILKEEDITQDRKGS